MFQNLIRILTLVVAAVAVVKVGAADEFRASIGIWRNDGTAATLTEGGRAVISKSTEPMKMWCNSTLPWKDCYWVWKKKAEENVRHLFVHIRNREREE